MTANTLKTQPRCGHGVQNGHRTTSYRALTEQLAWDDARVGARLAVTARSAKRWRIGQVEPPVWVLRHLRAMLLLTRVCPTAATCVTSQADTLEALAAMPAPVRLLYEAGRPVPMDGDTGRPYGQDAEEYL